MTQREQAVAGVFHIEIIIGPMAVEATFGGPQAVDEVEGEVAKRIEFQFEAFQRMKGGGGAEQVGEGGTGSGEESSTGMHLLLQPRARFRMKREVKVAA